MNERIRELARQSGGIDITNHTAGGTTTWIGTGTPEFLERFAELIIRACVQTLIDNTPERYTNESAEEDWDKGYDRAMKDCVHHIQEYFGVEE